MREHLSGTWRPIVVENANSTSSAKSEEKHRRISSWLLDDLWSISDLHDDQADWVIQAKSNGTTLLIIQASRTPGHLSIQGSVNLNNKSRESLLRMEPAKRREMLWDMRMGLFTLSVVFIGIAEPLEVVMVRKDVYDDGLTQDLFFHRLTQVQGAILFVRSVIQRHYSEPPPEESHEGFFVN